jgi:subtilisin family serine protease
MLTTLHLAVDNCVNDSLFIPQQNELSNGGTFGPNKIPMDIQACGAWKYSTGVGVDIAVVDEGFENDHPDLISNVVNTGYDAILGSSPTHVYGPHGTSCAGIAAAKGNNSIGVAGVAYNSGLMSVAINRFDPPSWAQRADAINWAWQHGAEVISNSWNTSVGVPSSFFDAAVIFTQTFGRGGLGSVVVFSTNNWNWSYIEYPANSNADVIAVGASQDSTRATFTVAPAVASNYGPGLDIVAPGVGLASTDLQIGGYNTASGSAGYYVTGFQGTSGACPIIAGVAALILSVNPCLTQHEVGTIINRTASKMGNYSYTTTAANPDGTWNNEMGYGLVDANAAVIMAMAGYLQNQTITGVANYLTRPVIQAGHHVNPFITQGNFITTSTANLTINCSKFIEFKEGCDLQGIVDAHIGTVGNCNTW